MSYQTKFTLGPWYYAVGEDSNGEEYSNHLWSNVNPNPFVLTFNPKHPDIQANASLIASSPDLLESLINLLEMTESYHCQLFGVSGLVNISDLKEHPIVSSRAAIEKALNIKK